MADERQERITRRRLIPAVPGGTITLVTIVIPLLVPGKDAFTGRIMTFVVPCCAGMAVTAIFFVYSTRTTDSG